MTLTSPTDEQLEAAFATEVAGYSVKNEFPGTDFPFTAWQGDKRLSDHRWASASGPLSHITPFCRSFDAVLPWIEKWGYVDINRDAHYSQGPWSVSIAKEPVTGILYHGSGKTLQLAAVICLLRAHGVQVGITEGNAQ